MTTDDKTARTSHDATVTEAAGEKVRRQKARWWNPDSFTVLASEADAVIDTLTARNRELEGDLNIARLERDAKLCSECPRGPALSDALAREKALRDLIGRAMYYVRNARTAGSRDLAADVDALLDATADATAVKES